MSTSYESYDAFVPAQFCDSSVKRLVSKLLDYGYGGVGISDEGARFPVIDGGTCDSPSIAWYYQLRMAPEWCNELVRKLIKENKISLDFSYHYDSGGGYYEEEGLPDWEHTLLDCPTLILREILARRNES